MAKILVMESVIRMVIRAENRNTIQWKSMCLLKEVNQRFSPIQASGQLQRLAIITNHINSLESMEFTLLKLAP